MEIDTYMATPSGMSARVDALLTGTGLVDTEPSYDEGNSGLSVRLTCRDRIGAAMRWTNTGQSRIPRRVLNNTTLPGVVQEMQGLGSQIPWGLLSSTSAVPSGFMPPIPSGLLPRGSSYSAPYWFAGWAPWSQDVSPVTGVVVTTTAGGDCPQRDFAVLVFAADAADNVSDPEPYFVAAPDTTVVAPNQTIHVEWNASVEATKYFCVLYANYFGWRPQQCIETTGLSCDFNHAFDPPDPGTGYADGATGIEQVAYYYSARSKSGPLRSEWHEVEDPTNWPAIFGTTIILPNSKTRPIRVFWGDVGSPAYEAKRFGTDLVFPVPATQTEDGLIYFDDDFFNVGGVANSEVDRPMGRVKVEYTRDIFLADGNLWHEFHIAGVPCKDVGDWYYDPGGDPTDVEINLSSGTEFLIPKSGNTDWTAVFGTKRYRDIVGADGITRRYTMMYARGTRGEAMASGFSILTLNLEGVESQGDCDGSLITDLMDQCKHFLQYFAVASGEGYTSGLYGDVPRQGVGLLPIVDEDSFDDVKAMFELELDGGLVGAGITGAGGELVDVSVELKRWMMSGHFRLGPNRNWQVSAYALNERLTSSGVSAKLTDQFDLHRRTFKPTPRLTELQNAFRYWYQRDYVQHGGWLVDDQEETTASSITNWGLTRYGDDLSFHYLEDPAVVRYVLDKYKRFRANVPMYAEFEGDLCLMGAAYDIGTYHKLDHFRGPRLSGWANRVMWVLGHTFLPRSRRVRLNVLDVTPLISGG